MVHLHLKPLARGMASQRIYDAVKPLREPASLPMRVVPLNECPKCGKRVGRGRHMHIKNCKGQ